MKKTTNPRSVITSLPNGEERAAEILEALKVFNDIGLIERPEDIIAEYCDTTDTSEILITAYNLMEAAQKLVSSQIEAASFLEKSASLN